MPGQSQLSTGVDERELTQALETPTSDIHLQDLEDEVFDSENNLISFDDWFEKNPQT